MRLRKPCRIVPLNLRRRYRNRRTSAGAWQTVAVFAMAALLGAIVGAASLTPAWSEVSAQARSVAVDVAVDLGLARKRLPQEGDYWRYCELARSAGTAPIYLGEPGYRPELDSDGDGIACERHRHRHRHRHRFRH